MLCCRGEGGGKNRAAYGTGVPTHIGVVPENVGEQTVALTRRLVCVGRRLIRKLPLNALLQGGGGGERNVQHPDLVLGLI